jgi:very-short-patch-repair endonuclease
VDLISQKEIKDGRVKQNKMHNHKHLEERRKELRKSLTPAEATLWKSLQRKQLKNRKFRRQHSIKNFIVDFYCASEKLIVELDGAVHLDFAQQNYDYERTLVLEDLGFKIVRFENKLIFENLPEVLEKIASHFKG